MKNLSPVAVALAAVVQLVMLAVAVLGWRRLTRQSQHLLARIAVLELDVQGHQEQLDTMTATQAWRKAWQDITGRKSGRHLASVTTLLPCPEKGVHSVDTPGGAE